MLLGSRFRARSLFLRKRAIELGIRLDKDLIAFLEVKRVTLNWPLNTFARSESYTVNEGWNG